MTRKKIKTGTLTYHSGYNYGASLQAFALQTAILRECDVENEIVNFETLDFRESRKMFSSHPRRAKEVIKTVARLPYFNSLKKREALFDDFVANQLRTSPLCRTREEVLGLVDSYDCLICGSDQIWNLGAYGDEFAANSLFFLDFPKQQKRVSYAASFGDWVKEARTRADEMKRWLSAFDNISVREGSGQDFLHEIGIESRVDVDPTLLLDADDYRVISRKPESNLPDRYILLFSWNVDRAMTDVAREAGRLYGIPVINIVPPPRAMFSRVRRKLDVGPREFLYLVDNAELVITGSFHGTVFSALFEKKFLSLYRSRPDTRMKSMLMRLGLDNRLRKIDDVRAIDFDSLLASDFEGVAKCLKDLRSDSLRYLKEVLS